jgi:hypothetical protein
MGAVVIHQGQANHLEVVLCLRTPSGFSCLLDRWQDKGHRKTYEDQDDKHVQPAIPRHRFYGDF